MDKGQEILKIPFFRMMLILSFFALVSLTACQSRQSPPTILFTQPTGTPLAEQPTSTLRAEQPIERQPTATVYTAPQPTHTTENITPTLSCLSQGGVVESANIFSEHLGDDLHLRVYIPPCYHTYTTQRYPVVYLLHGLYYNENQWLRLGLAKQMDRLIIDEAIAPFIVILPGESRFDPLQTSPYAEALTEELIPWVDQHYRTMPEKRFRAIGGLSRGGAWSVQIGLVHYTLFESVGAHSLPTFEVSTGRFATILGQVPSHDLPSFFIDIGNRDPQRSTAQAFADQLNIHNISHTWYLFNGGHTEDYWSAHLEHYLRWYARNW